jgi:hypothetical protein
MYEGKGQSLRGSALFFGKKSVDMESSTSHKPCRFSRPVTRRALHCVYSLCVMCVCIALCAVFCLSVVCYFV